MPKTYLGERKCTFRFKKPTGVGKNQRNPNWDTLQSNCQKQRHNFESRKRKELYKKASSKPSMDLSEEFWQARRKVNNKITVLKSKQTRKCNQENCNHQNSLSEKKEKQRLTLKKISHVNNNQKV